MKIRIVAGLLGLLAGSAAAQQPAFYPALDLPLDVLIDTKYLSSLTLPSLPFADTRHFTPTPHRWVRDIDGDGNLDGSWLFGGLWIFRGHGDGRFDGSFAPADLEIPWTMHGRWGDVTGDGLPDAVFMGVDSTQAYVDQGNGNFATSGIHDLLGNNDLWFDDWDIGDFTDDGLGDIATVNVHGLPGQYVAILTGAGDGTFAAPLSAGALSSFISGFGIGDADADGDLDLALGTENGNGGRLRLWTHVAGVNFAKHPNVVATAKPLRLELRDMTGDGLADVISHEGTTVVIYPGDGAGGLGSPLAVPGAGITALFADMNDDGLVDVVTDLPGEELGTQVLFSTPAGGAKPPVVTTVRADLLDTGDFDGDGVLDAFSPQVALHGRKDGRFLAPRAFDIGAEPSLPTQALFADFNEDGISDLLTLAYNDSNAFVNLSQLGASWRPPTTLYSSNGMNAGAVGDLDGDGHLDVIATHWLGATADTWLGSGQGGFVAGPVISMGGVFGNSGIGIGRFDTNAPADLVATGEGQLIVRRGQGALQFGAAQITPLPGSINDPWLVVRDLDGDALDDLVVLPQLRVYRCIGHGEFAAPQALGASASALEIADLDGDGQLDLLAAYGKVVTAYLQHAGVFAPAPFAPLTSEFTVLGLDLADVDGDGLRDVALGHAHSWSLHLGAPGGGWAPEPVDVFDLSAQGLALRFEDGNADGRPDLLTAGAFAAPYSLELGLAFFVHQLGPWADAGFALQSANGEPFLWPSGTLLPNSSIGLVVRDARSHAPVTLIAGLGPAMTAFKGGTLVPEPLLALGLGLTSTAGLLEVESLWPAGVPSGTTLWLQAWIKDPSGPAGYAATNGVSGTTP